MKRRAVRRYQAAPRETWWRRLRRWLLWHTTTRVEASTRGDGVGLGREFADRAREKRKAALDEPTQPGDGWAGEAPYWWLR